MTPFMLRVQDVLAGGVPPRPATEPSQSRTTAVGTHAQVAVRSLCEQLVSEANAVLRPSRGDVVELVDSVGTNGFAFTLRYRDRAARIGTAVDSGCAVARVRAPDIPADAAVQLRGEEEVAALLLTLIANHVPA